MGWVLGAVQSRHTVAAAGVLTGMVAGQLYLWLLLCWMVCKGKGCYIWWLLPMLLPGAYGMEGVPDGVSDELPVIVSAILAAVEVGGELPEWFDLGAWVAEKDEWELSWGRLVDWLGGQQDACVSLTGLEARLRSMYEWLVRQQDVSHRYKEVCEAARQWEDDTGETLVWFGTTHITVFTWGGQILPQAPETHNIIRLMFLNVRHFKAGPEGTAQAQEIWTWCQDWAVDVAAISDHCLSAGVGAAGKWDLVVGHGLPPYRGSGHQARETRTWGGEGMQWSIGEGLPSSNGPGGGTLHVLAVAQGNGRWDRELEGTRGWGRWTGKTVMGKLGAKLIVVSVYGSVRSDSSGSIWQQQLGAMQGITADGRVQDPRQQFLYDLYTMMWKYAQTGWMLVVGGDFNFHWNSDLMGVASSGGVGGPGALRGYGSLLSLCTWSMWWQYWVGVSYLPSGGLMLRVLLRALLTTYWCLQLYWVRVQSRVLQSGMERGWRVLVTLHW